MSQDDKYSYEIIDNEQDAITCARLIAEEFASHDPLTVFEKIPADHFFEVCAWPVMRDAWEQRLSYLVRDRSTGQIVATVCIGDMFLRHPIHTKYQSPELQSIAVDVLLDEMADVFVQRDFGQELKPKFVIQVMIGATKTGQVNRGIMSNLALISTDNARDAHGFTYALTQTTNTTARHILVDKLEGKEVTVLDPTTWKWKAPNGEICCPYKDYKGGVISNILSDLRIDETNPSGLTSK